ncbi:hypothetical protein B9Z19DRAFT_1065072 [Tuber borchii]|uniref:Transposase Tc1-like domain-containing protein n=1 Tax=Tuber borchii TaxID=42251 RepID=A0A2T6ZSC7_TUBBO|nr:hypothetical protein B9Z19DRAFT_1065072 [Tuber borchii]
MSQAEKAIQKPGRHEVDVSKRGAVIALREAGHKLKEIQSITNIPRSTIAGIIKHVQNLSKDEKENCDPSYPGPRLNNTVLNPLPPPGRLRKFSDEDYQTVVEYATRNRAQRHKSFAQLAKELPFSIHRTQVAIILKKQGYSLHIPRTKPAVSKPNQSAQHGERGQVQLMEDGAGPHRAKHLNAYYHEKGINKVDWPAYFNKTGKEKEVAFAQIENIWS